jgi:two-component system heavy metal sensor histidine kinase CusS
VNLLQAALLTAFVIAVIALVVAFALRAGESRRAVQPARHLGAAADPQAIEQPAEDEDQRRLSGFASFVAHELRNPLAVARARIELTERSPGVTDSARRHGRRALQSLDAAIAILERLELFSRAEAGRIEARRDRFDLARAIAVSIERLRATGSEREVAVRGQRAQPAHGDQHLAELAITNLLVNADRYSRPSRPIRVEVSGGEQVTVKVIDDGPGIDDELAESLFRERVSAGKGLGLGLYLVRATMEAQGGSVSLEQRRPRAVFALRWPADSAVASGSVDAA